MKFEDLIGTGRIGEIISALKTTYNVDNTRQLSEDIKLNALLTSLQVSGLELDEIIANNSPVFRTIKGHAFEIAFEYLIKAAGFEVTSIGGDGNVDLIVNKVKLQLKTPYSAGTAGSIVQYKTHKTHGAKSEKESMDYYHHADEFADYLVGLISYEPLRIIFISKDELPRHSKSKHHILSPFKIDWETHSVDSRLFKAETLYRETYDLLFAKYGNNISQKIFKNTIEKKGDTETTLKENEPILITDFLQKMYDDSKSGKRKTVDGMKFKPGSIKPYISTKNHFVAFSKRRKYYLTDIDQTLINDFTEYLNGFLALNASAKYLTVLKSLISFATQKKLISINVSLENKVIVRKAKADDIYLTEKEIQEIMDIKEFPTKKIEEVRDLFVIGCNTGLRFQDYSMLKIEQIKDGFLEFDPKKLEGRYNLTTKVVIPVLPMFEEIIKKYPNGFPVSPCNQVVNKYLKKIAEKVPSLKQNYNKKIVGGHEVKRKPLKKWQMVVTHTARRSFCTNMYLRGIQVPTIMAISGHRTEENFLKYIKADNRKHAEIMIDIFNEGEKQKAEMLRKKLEDDKKRENGEDV